MVGLNYIFACIVTCSQYTKTLHTVHANVLSRERGTTLITYYANKGLQIMQNHATPLVGQIMKN